MKKLFLFLAVLFLIEFPTLLDISIIDIGPEKSAGADHSTVEQPAPAAKEGASEQITDNLIMSQADAKTEASTVSATGEESASGSEKKTELKLREEQTSQKETVHPVSKESSATTSEPWITEAHTEEATEQPAPIVVATSVPDKETKTQSKAVVPAKDSAESDTKTTVPVKDSTEADNKNEVPEEDSTKADTKTNIPSTKINKANTKSETTSKSPTKTATKTATEQTAEVPACKHSWTWATHTETKYVPEVSHKVPIYNDGWDEAVTVRKIYCSECHKIYEDLDDYYDHDFCFGSFGHKTVTDHYIHHEPELLYYDTIVDEPEHNETVTIKDYQYCSLCGERK